MADIELYWPQVGERVRVKAPVVCDTKFRRRIHSWVDAFGEAVHLPIEFGRTGIVHAIDDTRVPGHPVHVVFDVPIFLPDSVTFIGIVDANGDREERSVINMFRFPGNLYSTSEIERIASAGDEISEGNEEAA